MLWLLCCSVELSQRSSGLYFVNLQLLLRLPYCQHHCPAFVFEECIYLIWNSNLTVVSFSPLKVLFHCLQASVVLDTKSGKNSNFCSSEGNVLFPLGCFIFGFRQFVHDISNINCGHFGHYLFRYLFWSVSSSFTHLEENLMSHGSVRLRSLF